MIPGLVALALAFAGDAAAREGAGVFSLDNPAQLKAEAPRPTRPTWRVAHSPGDKRSCRQRGP